MEYSNTQKSPWLFRFVFVLFAAVSMSLLFNPDVKSSIRSRFTSENRSVLSKARAIIDVDDGQYSFVKGKTHEGLFVEVYKDAALGNTVLIDRINLPQHKDAFFTFNGQATNLALDDIDGDKKVELLVPSFDRELVAHLNVFKFNFTSRRFEAVDPTTIK